MAKAATHIDKQYRLGGVWKKAYNDVASSLGGDGYSYYDIDVKKLVNPVTASKQTKVYLNLIVYVPKFQRHRASQHIKNNITAIGLNAEYKKGDYEVDVSVTDSDGLTKILRLQIKPEAGGGSGGGARETQRTECAQALFASYAFNVMNNGSGGYINDEDSVDLKGLESAAQWIHIDDQLSEILPEKLEPDWVKSCIRVANRLWNLYGGAGKGGGKYEFYRGKGFDGKSSAANTIAKAYARCNNPKSGKKVFSTEDKWNPADIWMATSKFKGQMLHEKDSANKFEITTWEKLNNKIATLYNSRDLIGISLKKVTNATAKDTEVNVDKEAQKESADKITFVKHGLIYQNLSKKKEEDAYPMDVYLYYGDGANDRFQARNFGGGTKSSWQIELKGGAANMGRVGGGSVDTLLKNMEIKFPKSTCMHTSFDNTKIWNDCAKKAANMTKVCTEIVRLLIKHNADGMKSNPTEEEKNDWILRISKRTQSYRYSKLLGLYLLDTIAKNPSANNIISTLYMYAASKSDESSVFVKME